MMNPNQVPHLQGQPSSARDLALEKKRKRIEKAKQKKLDRRERLQEQKRSLLKEHLARELRYGLHTFKKHQMDWRKLLTDLTLPLQREELEFVWQNFERMIDMKDFAISCLMDELHRAEDQYMTNLSCHVQTCDRLIALFHEQLDQLHNDYHNKIQSLKDEEDSFCSETSKTTNKSTHYIKAMLFGMEFEDKERERSLRADVCARVELVSDFQDALILHQRGRLENNFEVMWKKTRDVLEKFRRRSQDRQEEYDELKAADDKVQELLSFELRKIGHLLIVIKRLKKKEDDIGENNLESLRADVKSFQDACLVLKQKLAADLKIDKQKQEYLVSEFHDSYLKMKNILKKGDYMMRLLKSCRKLETAEEKVRPYPSHRMEIVKDHQLFLFWQRIGKINASRTELYEEKITLISENQLLKKKIKQICTCLSCPKLPPICRREGPIPFTDGMTLMKKYEMQNFMKRR